MLDIVYRQVESNDLPQEIDTTSSPTTVYFRKNIRTETRTDVETGESRTVYLYDEAKASQSQYIAELQSRQEETDEAVQELILAMFGGD
jgi:hypothetical protein